MGGNGNLLVKAKPYMAMICLQIGYAGVSVTAKVAINRGMSHYVLVTYRHAFATAVIAPFALILERKLRPKLTFTVFMQLFFLGLIGPVFDQNMYYAGLKLTSPTFSCAISNMLPAMTFVMAVLCRMEKLEMKKVWCQAKVVGTIVTVAGGMLMTLYKGHVIKIVWSKYIHLRKFNIGHNTQDSDKDWVKGSILLIIATLAWAAFFILQAFTLRKYTALFSATALVCFLGTLQSIAATFVMEHRPNVWSIGWDIKLLAAASSGIVASGIAFYVQGIVMQKRGPVFVTAFTPLTMIIAAIMDSFILSENLYVGGVIGAVLIVIGLYSVLWGKYKESNEREREAKGNSEQVKNSSIIIDQDIAANAVQIQTNEENNI